MLNMSHFDIYIPGKLLYNSAYTIFLNATQVFYSTVDGKENGEMDLKMLLTNIERIKWIKMTKDLTAIAAMDSNLKITWVSLHEYTATFSPSVRVGGLESCNYLTSKLGDSMWREKISTTHAKHIKFETGQNLVSKNRSTTSRKWTITGFSKKKPSIHRLENCIHLPEFFKQLRQCDVAVGPGIVTLTFKSEEEFVLCICDFSAKTCVTER